MSLARRLVLVAEHVHATRSCPFSIGQDRAASAMRRLARSDIGDRASEQLDQRADRRRSRRHGAESTAVSPIAFTSAPWLRSIVMLPTARLAAALWSGGQPSDCVRRRQRQRPRSRRLRAISVLRRRTTRAWSGVNRSLDQAPVPGPGLRSSNPQPDRPRGQRRGFEDIQRQVRRPRALPACRLAVVAGLEPERDAASRSRRGGKRRIGRQQRREPSTSPARTASNAFSCVVFHRSRSPEASR